MDKLTSLLESMNNTAKLSNVINIPIHLTERPFIDKAIQAITSRKLEVDKTMQAFSLRQLEIEKAMQAFASRQEALQRVFLSIPEAKKIEAEMAMSASIRYLNATSVMESYNINQLTINKAMKLLSKSLPLEKALNDFALLNSTLLPNPDYLKEMSKTLSNLGFHSADLDNFQGELKRVENEVSEEMDSTDFKAPFYKLNPFLVALVYKYFVIIISQLLLGLAVNVITPHILNYLEGNSKVNKEKIKDIKRIPLQINDVDTNGLRFITGNNVRVRADHSTKSEIYDELVLGQIVTVLHKERNWLNVTYTYENGESATGWVFTKHTSPFIKKAP